MVDQDSDFDFAGELANMDDIQTGSALLPEDEYNWLVKGATTGVSSNGNPSINLQLEIIDGPYRGKSVIHNIYYSTQKQSGIEFFWRQLKTLGITSGMVRDEGWTQKVIAAKMVNAQITAKIKHETYQEVERAKTQLTKLIVNPNLKGGGASAPGTTAAPSQNTLPKYVDDGDNGAEPASQPESVGAPAGTPTAVDDDPWGSQDS
jgi:hypothetical protein